jgi:hypothetical protein
MYQALEMMLGWIPNHAHEAPCGSYLFDLFLSEALIVVAYQGTWT